MEKVVRFVGQMGRCGQREVFLGFAPAMTLCAASSPDVLNEHTGEGYQRRFTAQHSLEFKRYIQTPGATSIPLTFNLRESLRSRRWKFAHASEIDEGMATLELDIADGPVMAQVDGQHRLGFLQDSPIQFPFMAFFGLSIDEEMEIFRTINGKAKGLSSSLLDYTQARLIDAGLAHAKPELFIALGLNSEPTSPWFTKLDLGGQRTVGLQRRASLRTMQHAVKRMVKAAGWPATYDAQRGLEITVAFWRAIAFVLPEQWDNPRQHLLSKGVGVYALMALAGTFVRENKSNRRWDFDFFVSKLSDFVDQVDWSTSGPLEGYGGVKGAEMAYQMLLQIRSAAYGHQTAHAQ